MNNKYIIALTLMLGVVFAGHVSAQMGSMTMEPAKTEAVKTTTDATKTAEEAAKTADQTAKTADEAAKTADQTAKTAEDKAKTADDAAKTKDVKKEAAVQTCGQPVGSSTSDEGEDE